MDSRTVLSPLPPDDVLTVRLAAGDEEAFRLVLDRWSPGMLRLARDFVSTRASAEEVVQETWMAVFRGIARFEGRSSLKTWVYRILVRTAKARGVKEQRTIPMSGSLPEAESDAGPTVDPSRFRGPDDPYPGHWRPGQAPAPWNAPEDRALVSEVRRVIGDALAALPARYRVVLSLRDIEGYGSDEVCELLGITAGNQRVLLHRARAQVRRRLEEYFGAAEGAADDEL
ncbi:sigma-70 family RNA polymerase sigma factor [Streptosporangiaceae bacterium NEAU-GS5]|nr:sigma-70 family RNA polymerase sigma factor [Streptosporangiaceae bacterium NEAU-GS5]